MGFSWTHRYSANFLAQSLIARRGRHVERHEIGQHPGALDVLEELEPESLSLVGALDDSGMSATTKVRDSLMPTTPRLGSSVVNG